MRVENIDGLTYFWRFFFARSKRNIAKTQLDNEIANRWSDLGVHGFSDIHCVAFAEKSSKYAGPFGRKLPNSVGQITQILAC
jgi:hypothetical protein